MCMLRRAHGCSTDNVTNAPGNIICHLSEDRLCVEHNVFKEGIVSFIDLRYKGVEPGSHSLFRDKA